MKANFALVTLATVAFGCVTPASSTETDTEPVSKVTAAQKADQIHESPWQPFVGEGVSSCSAETYAFVGSMKLHERIVEDGAGGVHIFSQLRVRGTAVGNVTGASYRTSEGGMTVEKDSSSGASSFHAQFSGNLIAQGPVPNENYSLLLYITINANGEVTSKIDRFEVVCH
jgi:hypothetical protein